MKAELKFKMLALVVGILVPALFIKLFPTVDLWLYDLALIGRQDFCVIFRENKARALVRHQSIAMLGEKESRELTPGTRAKLAQQSWGLQQDVAAARSLVEAGAAAVVLDRPLSLPEAEELRRANPDLDRVYLPIIGNVSQSGDKKIEIVPWRIKQEGDQPIRWVYLALRDSQGVTRPTIPLLLYAQFLQCPLSEIGYSEDKITVANATIPVTRDDFGLAYLPDLYPVREDVLKEAQSVGSEILDTLQPGTLQEIIGEARPLILGLAPKHYFFIGSYRYEAEGERPTYHGNYRDFQLQAITLHCLMQGSHVQWITGWKLVVAFLAWNLLLANWVFARRSGLTLVLEAALRGFFLFAGVILLTVGDFYLPPGRFLLSILLYSGLAGLRMWLSTVTLLHRFGGRTAALAAQFGMNDAFSEIDDRVATILFFNLPDHLKALERQNSPDLLSRRKEFSAMVTHVCSRNQGIIHDYQGDALMIGFGTDVMQRDPGHALKAILAAQQLHREFAALASLWLEALDPEQLHLYVGICTGEVAVGFVGASHYKKAPAAIGDTTNVAARLMGAAKKQHVDILISRPTQEACSDQVVTESLPAVQLKGKSHLVEIFRVVEVKGPA